MIGLTARTLTNEHAMIEEGVIIFMYHEIRLESRALCRHDPGYTRYAVSVADFQEQLDFLRSSGLVGASVTEAMDDLTKSPRVALTFDDGAETDLICVAPLLKSLGFNATFFIVPEFVGRRGFLSEAQLGELGNSGFEIGCHSMTHAYLSDLNEDRLRVEVVEAKNRLEDQTGRRVDHLSCPGGRWSERVRMMAREAGFLTVSTSRVGINTGAVDPFRLSRVAVMADTRLSDFQRAVEGRGLTFVRAREYALSAAKRILGNSFYERARSAVLSSRSLS